MTEYRAPDLSQQQQANEFAGSLLVPTDKLRHIVISELKGKKVEGISNDRIREYLASKISGKFGVSSQVISRRLVIENII